MGRYGLILVDPSDPRLKRAALPVYRRSLEKHRDEVNPALNRVNERLKKSGYHNQVGHRMDTLDFFYNKPRRLPFVRENGSYVLKGTGRHFTRDQIEKFLEENVENFSPNVILRPQVQDYLFPTAAYVAGPSEIAYFAQYKDVYRVFENPMPIIYPRKSLTLIEAKVEKALKKYSLDVKEIFQHREEEILKQVLDAQLPDSLHRVMERVEKEVFKQLDQLEKEAADLNPNLRPVVRKLKGKVQKELSHTNSKIIRVMDKKDNIIKNQVSKIFVNIFPDHHLQERRLNILNFFHKYFHRFIYRLMELTCCKHENNHIVWRINV